MNHASAPDGVKAVDRRPDLGVGVLFVLAMWTVRPEPFLPWFGAAGLGNETPLTLLKSWAGDHLAPTTPVGLLSLFPAGELVLVIGLIVTLLVLLILFRAEWRDLANVVVVNQANPSASPFTRNEGPNVARCYRRHRSRARVGDCDLEKLAECSEQYRARAGQLCRKRVQGERVVATRRDGCLPIARTMTSDGLVTTPAARAAERAYQRDELGREHVYYSALVSYHGERKRVYQAAAMNISLHDPPRPFPIPETAPGHELGMFLFQKQYAQALARLCGAH